MASIFGSLLGKAAGDAAEKIGSGIASIIGSIYTTEGEKLDKQTVLARVGQAPLLQQLAINLAEAQHRSIWVAGWRPFIGWMCGSALAYNFIFRDLLAWAILMWAPGTPPPPELDIMALLTILGGMLGLGGLRTAEKIKGVTK